MDILAYYQSLPRKICTAAALFLDEQGHLLIVKPTYREGWLLPGGTVERDESPRQGCIREVEEEIGLLVPTLTLLCVDHVSAHQNKPENVVFIFKGKVLDTHDINAIKLQASELSEYRFVNSEEAGRLLNASMVARLSYSLDAYQQDRITYLENGQALF